ncbi:hypothetical protein BH20ACI4_BH20ACI4_28450 [soil metagenome]
MFKAEKGLASIDAPSGTLLAYSTVPGSVASDGTGRNGLYTQELLKAIRTDSLSIEDVILSGHLYFRNKQFDPAISNYTKAIEIKPSADLYKNRAYAYEAKGDKNLAKADRQKAEQLKENK